MDGSCEDVLVLRVGPHLVLQFLRRLARHRAWKRLVHRPDASVDVRFGQLRRSVPAHLVDDVLGPARLEDVAVRQRQDDVGGLLPTDHIGVEERALRAARAG